jgi:glycosyltransferase involved in cell wall biosynthesis
VCVPSLVEGFSLVALEAQLAQAPLAVANITALRETAPQAPCFDPQDAQACAQALHAALQQSAADRQAVATHAADHTWDACAERLVEGWCRAAQL